MSNIIKDGYLSEKPAGICPSCGQSVFNSLEKEGPVWVCPMDLNPKNVYFLPSPVKEKDKEKMGDYSNCSAYHGYPNHSQVEHLPLHAACYENGKY